MQICTAPRARLSVAVLLGLLGSAPSARAVVTIDVGSATGAPGSTVTFNVVLSTGGEQVGGTLNSVSFDPATPIVACTTNPGLTLSQCNALPQDCTPGVDCQEVRCFIAQLASPPPPIANGTLLYSCSVKVAPNATEGSYPLLCSGQSASDPDGHTLDVQCMDGQVQVVGPTLAPTATATRTQTPTITRTPTATATPGPPTATPAPGGSGGGGGCQIGSMRLRHTGWLLLLPTAALLWWRRCR